MVDGLYVSKKQDSSQAQTVVALNNQEILRGGKRDPQKTENVCEIAD